MKYVKGDSKSNIAREEGLAVSTVHGIIQRYPHQKSAVSSPRSGRPQKLSAREKRLIFRVARLDPFISAQKLIELTNINVSPCTITEWLEKDGIAHKRAICRPLLTPEVARKRLEFALMYQDKPASFWKSVIFSDECSIARGDGVRQSWVFVPQEGHLYIAIAPPTNRQ